MYKYEHTCMNVYTCMHLLKIESQTLLIFDTAIINCMYMKCTINSINHQLCTCTYVHHLPLRLCNFLNNSFSASDFSLLIGLGEGGGARPRLPPGLAYAIITLL